MIDEPHRTSDPAGMVVSLLEALINRMLRLDNESLRRLGELDGKVIRIVLGRSTDSVAPVEIYALPSADGLRLRRQPDREPDVTLSGTLPVLLRLGGGDVRPELFASGDLEISGDAELGRRFQRAMVDLDIDWEEQASRIVGDVAAHELGNLLHGARAWQARSLRSLGEDLTEYLQEESRVLVNRNRVEAFLCEVDGLRADADRLEARLRRLQGRAR
ncbi:MAG: SCP2 sterol-binding domain-containing protein [Gammaproteobacteria bacterium]|nr:MAG: SCP2 sterol-binding domain-containing protein [Gammaproteobacteria bacterium]